MEAAGRARLFKRHRKRRTWPGRRRAPAPGARLPRVAEQPPGPPGCGSGRHRLCPGARSGPCPPRALGGVVRRSAPPLRARGASSAPPCSSCARSGTRCYCHRYPRVGSVRSRMQRFNLKACRVHGKKFSFLRYGHPESFLSELALLSWRFAPFGMGSDVPRVLHLGHVMQRGGRPCFGGAFCAVSLFPS